MQDVRVLVATFVARKSKVGHYVLRLAVADRLLDRLVERAGLVFPVRPRCTVLGVFFSACFAFFAIFGAVRLTKARLVVLSAFLALAFAGFFVAAGFFFVGLFAVGLACPAFERGFATFDFFVGAAFPADAGFFSAFTPAALTCCLARWDRYDIENFAWLSIA